MTIQKRSVFLDPNKQRWFVAVLPDEMGPQGREAVLINEETGDDKKRPITELKPPAWKQIS